MAYALDWIHLVVRWAHFIAGVSWIGASFYFVWLDNNLRAPTPEDRVRGVSGDLWSVHGGGFYHNQKYLTGPRDEPLTEDLHWFKWEAYTTWFTGLALLAILYWAGASTYLIDPSVMALTPPVAIAISIATLVVGWFVYDALCKLLVERPALLGGLIALFILLVDWALFHVFSARAAAIHVGAMIGTIMVVNVMAVVIPGQRAMLAEIRAGREPNPRPGFLGKVRSVHNTYFTLPVLFSMISGHFPMSFSGPYGWLSLALICAAGVLVRLFFVLTHKRRFVIALPLAALVLLVLVAIANAPRPSAGARGVLVSFAQVEPIIRQRCAVCHAAHPVQPGFAGAPEGIMLDSPVRIAGAAARIYQQAVITKAMPLGNITKMSDLERALIAQWFTQGAKTR